MLPVASIVGAISLICVSALDKLSNSALAPGIEVSIAAICSMGTGKLASCDGGVVVLRKFT